VVFGARVRQLREEIGIPLASLAATVAASFDCAMSPSELAALESGQRPVRLDEAVALAAVLDMTVEDMLHPALTPAEQLRRAQETVERASVRMAEARAEYDFAKTHLHRLRNTPAHTSNGDTGDQAHRAPVQLAAITVTNNGGSDGLHLTQREGPTAAG